jgi:uncharacterized protein (DUF1501 family)
MKGKKINRRQFIGRASCAAVGTATMFSSLQSLGMMNALSSPRMLGLTPPLTGNYKAMVCILLSGGNDSFNMLVPSTSEQYNVYANTRSNLALLQGDLLGLNYTDGGGVQYGLHPSMPEVQGMFNDGKLAFLSNVGTLIEPTTKTAIINETANLPLGLLSHSDQIRHWQTSLPQSRSAQGWGGRVADILQTLNENQDISMSLSLSGTNVWQTGNQIQEFAITPYGNGSVGIEVLEGGDFLSETLAGGVESMLDQQYQDIFKQTYAGKVQASQDQHEAFSGAIGNVAPFAAQFGDNYLADQLHMVAKSIAAAGPLNMQRQTYFVNYGGWDHHDEVLDNQAAMLAVVSQAMGAFNSAMEEIEMSDCVTAFTISDFARTLTSNGNGTDHGWGGNVMVMGGAVNGGTIYGQYPDLDLDGDLEVGGGVLIPQISTDEYFAELSRWFGVEDTNLLDILPNLENFWNIDPDSNPIGFLNI